MSSSSPLLYSPKKVTQDVDWSPAIRSIVASVYGEKPDEYTAECAALNRCRQDALRGTAGSDLTARDLLYKYFGQLELLELRFPELRVPFPWADAFTEKQISQLSLAYEKASVIFNIAATLSALAASQNRSSPEGLKRAFAYFKQSAGMYTYINDNFLHAPSTDLSKEVVKVLINLMLAQATEVFIERMPEEKKGSGLKAKVCNQAAGIYHSVEEDVKDFVNKGWFSRSWSLLIQCKASYFASLAQYHRATADTTAAKYADALARLTMALESAKDASRSASHFHAIFAPGPNPTLPADSVASLNEMTKTHQALVTAALATATKENDLIYHARPTAEASLPVLDKTSVADPVPIQEVYSNPEVQKVVGPDIFIKLVPLSVHESASMYSEEKAKLIRSEAEKVEVADGELVTTLEYLGLPGSLARFKTGRASDSPTEPSAMIRNFANEVRAQERSQSTNTMLTTLSTVKAQCSTDLQHASADLANEERECENARRRFPTTFDQPPSASVPIFRSLRSDIKERQDAIEHASGSDAQVLQAWNECRADIEILAEASGQSLQRLFSEAVGSSTNQQQDLLGDLNSSSSPSEEDEQLRNMVAMVESQIDRLYQIKRERAEVMKDLKERTQADDISHLLILNRKSQNIEPTLFAAELDKFRAHQNRISSTIHHQQAILQELSNSHQSLMQGSLAKGIQDTWNKSEKGRNTMETRFSHAMETYGDVRAGLGKGIAFYRDLAELLSSIRAETSRYVASRKAERASSIASGEMASKIQDAGMGSLGRSMADMSVASPAQQGQQPRMPLPPTQQNYGSMPPSRPPTSQPSLYGLPPPSTSYSYTQPSIPARPASGFDSSAQYHQPPQSPFRPSSSSSASPYSAPSQVYSATAAPQGSPYTSTTNYNAPASYQHQQAPSNPGYGSTNRPPQLPPPSAALQYGQPYSSPSSQPQRPAAYQSAQATSPAAGYSYTSPQQPSAPHSYQQYSQPVQQPTYPGPPSTQTPIQQHQYTPQPPSAPSPPGTNYYQAPPNRPYY